MYPRNVVCFKYIIVNTLHNGDKKDNNIIIIIIIIIEFRTSKLWLGNIHLSWDVVINKIRLGSLICS